MTRDKDYKDQISGKKPECRAESDISVNYDGEKLFDEKMESEVFITARTKNFQNICCPK